MDAILDTADIFDMAAILAMATALDTEAIIAMATILAIKYKLLKNTYKKERLQLKSLSFVGIPGLEPGKTGPESVVLPLHHIPICLSYSEQVPLVLNCGAKVLLFYELAKVL